MKLNNCISEKAAYSTHERLLIPQVNQGELKLSNDFNLEISLFVIILLIALSISTIFILTLRVKKYRAKLADFERKFMEGDEETFEFTSQAECLSYINDFEIPLDNLLYESQLGHGAYGKVFRGILSIHDGSAEVDKIVAIKQANNDLNAMEVLANEIKVMMLLREIKKVAHPNIVNSFGAVTKNITEGKISLVMELCENGNLEDFLRSYPGGYIDQIDRKSGRIDRSIVEPLESAALG